MKWVSMQFWCYIALVCYSISISEYMESKNDATVEHWWTFNMITNFEYIVIFSFCNRQSHVMYLIRISTFYRRIQDQNLTFWCFFYHNIAFVCFLHLIFYNDFLLFFFSFCNELKYQFRFSPYYHKLTFLFIVILYFLDLDWIWMLSCCSSISCYFLLLEHCLFTLSFVPRSDVSL